MGGVGAEDWGTVTAEKLARGEVQPQRRYRRSAGCRGYLTATTWRPSGLPCRASGLPCRASGFSFRPPGSPLGFPGSAEARRTQLFRCRVSISAFRCPQTISGSTCRGIASPQAFSGGRGGFPDRHRAFPGRHRAFQHRVGRQQRLNGRFRDGATRFRDAARANRVAMPPYSIGISPFTNGLGRCRNELSAYRRPPSGGGDLRSHAPGLARSESGAPARARQLHALVRRHGAPPSAVCAVACCSESGRSPADHRQ